MTAQPTLDPIPPRPPRRMKQPVKDAIRLRAELAEARLAYERTPIWWRLWRRIWVRIVEVDPLELRITIRAEVPPYRSVPRPISTDSLPGLDP